MSDQEKQKEISVRGSKTRVLLVVLSFVVLLAGIGVAIWVLKKQHDVAQFSTAALKRAPVIESLPGVQNSSEEYAKIQREENLQKAQEAAKLGTAAVPTIIRPALHGESTDFIASTGVIRPGCSEEEIKRARLAGVSAFELRCRGCSSKDMQGSYTVSELKAAGFSAAELKNDGFSPDELKEAGFGAKELLAAGYTPQQLKDAGYSVADLKAAGVSLEAIRGLRYGSGERRAAGFTAAEMRASGTPISDLKKAGFTAKELRDAGVTAQELNDAGYTPEDLIAAGFSDEELAKIGILPDQIKAARAAFLAKGKMPKSCSVADLTNAKKQGVSAASLHEMKCDMTALKAAGYTAGELRSAGFTAQQLKDAGFTPAELKTAGYTAADLKAIGFTPKDFKDAGFSPTELKAAGFTAQELKDAGFSAAALKEGGYTAAELNQAGYDPAELLKAGFTPSELRSAGLTAEQLKAAGASVADLKKAGFTDGDLIRAGFVPEEVNPPTVVAAPGGAGASSAAGVGAGAAGAAGGVGVAGAAGNAGEGGSAGAAGTAGAAGNEAGAGNIASVPGSEASTEKVLAAIQARQAAQMNAQEQQDLLQQLQTNMTTQASQLFASWTPPPTQTFVEHSEDKNSPSGGSGGSTGAKAGQEGGAGAASGGPVIKAGTVMFGVLDTGINSDEPSPILATIVLGELKGAKLLGQFTRVDKKVLVSFTTMSLPNVTNSFTINAVAIDPNTARTAIASDVNSHYLLRYGTLFASSFLTGFSQAVSQSGATTTVQPFGGTTTSSPPLTTSDKIAIALGQVGTQYAAELGQNFTVPPTVKVDAGVSLGILFMADLNVPASTGAAQ